jgi:hypothetical protein
MNPAQKPSVVEMGAGGVYQLGVMAVVRRST